MSFIGRNVVCIVVLAAAIACSKEDAEAPKTRFESARDTVLRLYGSTSYEEMVAELRKSLGQPDKNEDDMVYWFETDPKGDCISFAIGKNAEGKAAYYDTLGAEPGDCK